MLLRHQQLENFHRRRGSLMPMIAIALLVVGACLALVLNKYWLSDAREELRSVAQAAALSGAAELASDEQLAEGFDSQHLADHVRVQLEQFAIDHPVFGGIPARFEVSLFRTEFDPLTGRKELIQTDEFADTVVVNAFRNRLYGNPVGMMMPALSGTNGGDVGVRVEARINNRIQGLRPAGAGRIPAWPFAILQTSFDPTVMSWETVLETGIGPDLLGWDSEQKQVTVEGDGLPELVLNFSTEDIPGNMLLLQLMHDVTEEELVQQTRDGWSAEDLLDHQGELLFDQGGVAMSARDSMPAQVLDALQQHIGETRIVVLYEQQAPDTGGRNSSPDRLVASRIVGARLMDAQQTADGVRLVVQPGVVTTRTAVIDEAGDFDPAVIRNPYIYNLSLSQ